MACVTVLTAMGAHTAGAERDDDGDDAVASVAGVADTEERNLTVAVGTGAAEEFGRIAAVATSSLVGVRRMKEQQDLGLDLQMRGIHCLGEHCRAGRHCLADSHLDDCIGC